jgi:hypothetical protein
MTAKKISKMRWICHRGNLNGKSDNENKPEQIIYCLKHGFDVEIDVWHVNNEFYLGHDAPQYKIDKEFLYKEGLWLHCKNIEALDILKDKISLNCFAIDKDDYVITTKNDIWLSPTYGKPYIGSICVMPEDPRWKFSSEYLLDFAGICSDNIYYYQHYVTNLRC